MSPRLFTRLFTDLRIDASYSAERVPSIALAAFTQRMRAGAFDGISVTMPLKQSILPLLDDVSPWARRVGAVNTVKREAGALRGDNTDGLGLIRALERHGVKLDGARVLLIGAGGAARAAAHALADAKAILSIANRTPEPARALAEELAATADPDPSRSEFDVVVNATPSTPALPRRCGVVLDMVYRPLETALLIQARASGAAAVDGLWMLVYQALEQLRLWRGIALDDTVATSLHAYLARVAEDAR